MWYIGGHNYRITNTVVYEFNLISVCGLLVCINWLIISWLGIDIAMRVNAYVVFQKIESAVGLVRLFEEKLGEYALHLFRVVNQFRQIRHVKSNISDQEMILHIDFSENYTSKEQAEVQAAHFGNHHQITIHVHQGVCYMQDTSPQCFATLSDDNRKTAEAVAAHVNSFLIDYNLNVKKVSCIIFSTCFP